MKSDLNELVIKEYLDSCDDKKRIISMIENLPFKIIENGIWNEKLFSIDNIYFKPFYEEYNESERLSKINSDLHFFRTKNVHQKLSCIFFRYGYYLCTIDIKILENWAMGQ